MLVLEFQEANSKVGLDVERMSWREMTVSEGQGARGGGEDGESLHTVLLV